jgi:hypothetical protein
LNGKYNRVDGRSEKRGDKKNEPSNNIMHDKKIDWEKLIKRRDVKEKVGQKSIAINVKKGCRKNRSHGGGWRQGRKEGGREREFK